MNPAAMRACSILRLATKATGSPRVWSILPSACATRPAPAIPTGERKKWVKSCKFQCSWNGRLAGPPVLGDNRRWIIGGLHDQNILNRLCSAIVLGAVGCGFSPPGREDRKMGKHSDRTDQRRAADSRRIAQSTDAGTAGQDTGGDAGPDWLENH